MKLRGDFQQNRQLCAREERESAAGFVLQQLI